MDQVLSLLSCPVGESDSILSFGPHFGEEAALSLVRSLELFGLVYADDFFMLETEIPEWCELGVRYKALPD